MGVWILSCPIVTSLAQCLFRPPWGKLSAWQIPEIVPCNCGAHIKACVLAISQPEYRARPSQLFSLLIVRELWDFLVISSPRGTSGEHR